MIEQSLWKILAFIMAVILMFIAPTITAYDRMDSITYNVVHSEVDRFCDGVRDTGVITKDNYNQFTSALARTGITYNITMEHYDKTYVPIYTGASFTGDYEIVYDSHYNETIEEALEDISQNNQYAMTIGDMIYVHVENTSATKSQTIRQMLIGVSRKYPVIIVRNGGMIRHESN